MTRIDVDKDTKGPTIITRADYEADRKRGYCVLEFSPAGEKIIKNPRNRTTEIRKVVPAMYTFRCMKCKFDAADTRYTPDPQTGGPRTGLDLIKLHVFRNEHPWPYGSFTNPYGNIEDVIIEGVDDYTKEI